MMVGRFTARHGISLLLFIYFMAVIWATDTHGQFLMDVDDL